MIQAHDNLMSIMKLRPLLVALLTRDKAEVARRGILTACFAG